MSKIHLVENPVSVEAVIEDLQNVLKKEVDWLDNIFPLSTKIMLRENKLDRYLPVYLPENGNHINLLPQRELGNYCFFTLDTPENILYQNGGFYMIKCNVSIVVHLNLNNVGVRLEQVKREFTRILSYRSWLTSGSFELKNVFDRHEEIWKGYTLSEVENQHKMYPYNSIRLSGTLLTKAECKI